MVSGKYASCETLGKKKVVRNRFTIPYLVCGLILISLPNSNAQMLDQYLWKNRVIIVNANTNSITQGSQERTLLRYKQELKERKIVILRYDNGEITRVYPDEEKQFKNQVLGIDLTGEDRFLLIGLDGGIKFRSNTVKSNQWIFDLIDSMPMRQSEIRRKQKKQ